MAISSNSGFSVTEVLAELKAVKQACIKSNSDEPVRIYFTALHQQVIEQHSAEMDNRHMRIQNLWTAQFDKWYVDFKSKLPSEVDW